jgi:ADP-ribosylglycohydrolase
VAPSAFSGEGSMGNGGAMRAGPVGAYFADDLATAAEQAGLSAEVTHAHPEGKAGAIAVATAAAWAWQFSRSHNVRGGLGILAAALAHTPPGPTQDGLVRAMNLDPDTTVQEAAGILGNGSGIVSEDTVPFAIWSAGRQLLNYEEAMWATASVWGDIDTNCAIVGSIIVMATGIQGIPESWRRSRESLDISGAS